MTAPMLRRTAGALLLAAAACAPPPPPSEADTVTAVPVVDTAGGATDLEAARARLEQARAAWAAQNVEHYRFGYRQRCFCPPSRLVVEVENGRARLLRAEGDSFAIQRQVEQGLPTVPSLFALLDSAIARRPAELRVTYDPQLHYPVEAWIDVDRQIADEEYGFELDSLTVLGRR